MANALPTTMEIGAIGELLVQLRLLEYGVQAAPPLKDTGNDLIAVRGRCVKFIQVKTNGGKVKQERVYDILAKVRLGYDANQRLLLDDTKIILITKSDNVSHLLNQGSVDEIWQ